MTTKTEKTQTTVRPVNTIDGKLVLRPDEVFMVRAALKTATTEANASKLAKLAEEIAETHLAEQPMVLVHALNLHVAKVSYYYARKVLNLVSKLERAAVQK